MTPTKLPEISEAPSQPPLKIAFLTEMDFVGKISADHPNMRTEFAWMHALGADHIPIRLWPSLAGYDHVFVIFPKGKVFLSAEGTQLVEDTNPVSDLLASPIIPTLKAHNRKVHYVQEGPSWWFTNYSLTDQINFYNMITQCDTIFTHNLADNKYYKGLFPGKPVGVIPTLMIDSPIADIKPLRLDKAIIGGNMSRWYGGFESMIVAQEFGVPISVQTSHASRPGEDQLVMPIPRLQWVDWMKKLSEFKYAVHLMPTVAAGTFALNCAYFGIPCIGNELVDTQVSCFPALSVDVHDLERARELARDLKDLDFYRECSDTAIKAYQREYSVDFFLTCMDYQLV